MLRRLRWPVLGVTIVVIVVATVVSRRDGGDPSGDRPGSRVVEGTVRPRNDPSRTYRITYRDETFGEAGDASVKETLTVRRPFDSRASSTAATAINTFGRYSLRGQTFFVPPSAAIGDVRPDAVLTDAVRDGYAQARETREVAGRRCRTYRVGNAALPRTLVALDEAQTHSDICVDASGLVLEEATFRGDDLIARRIAERVDDAVRIGDDTFDVREPDGDPREIGSLQELEDDSRLPGGDFWELGEPPRGLRFRGRYAVVPPAQPGFTDVTARGAIITFLSEVWTAGPDVVVIEQGATQGAKPFEPDALTRDVDAGDIGDGELVYSLRESEVRVLTGGARFVRVRGTLPPSRLLDIARSLEAVDGGPLRVKRD